MVSRGTAIMACRNHDFIIILVFITMALRTIDTNTHFQYHGGSVATKELQEVDSSNVTLFVNITLLNNPVSKGDGKCIYVPLLLSSFRISKCN